MNRILKYIIGCLLPLALLSCIKEEMPSIGNETIVLSINSGILTKAVADTDIEAKVSHIDVLIFDGSENISHYERVSDNGTNTITARAIMGSSPKMIMEIITSWITPSIITPKISCIEPPIIETSLVILDINSPLGVLSTTLIGILAIFSLIFTLILQVKKLLTE